MKVLLYFLLICTFDVFAYDFKTLNTIHKNAYSNHTYISDQEQYGMYDYWTPSLVGDCEDFALWVQQDLRSNNIKGDLWIVRTETNELHVVVVVNKFVLDNRFPTVRHINTLRYTWLVSVAFYNNN